MRVKKKGKRDDKHHKTERKSLLQKMKKMYRIIRLFAHQRKFEPGILPLGLKNRNKRVYMGELVHVPNLGGWQGRRTSHVPPSPPPRLIFKAKFKFFVTLPS